MVDRPRFGCRDVFCFLLCLGKLDVGFGQLSRQRFKRGSCFDEFGLCCLNRFATAGPLFLVNERLQTWIPCSGRQIDWLDGERGTTENRQCGWLNRWAIEPITRVAQTVHERFFVVVEIVDARQTGSDRLQRRTRPRTVADVLRQGRAAGNSVVAKFKGLEKRAKREVLLLGDRIVFVVVTVCTVDPQSQECLAGVLHQILLPRVVVQRKPITNDKPQCRHPGIVSRVQFVRG